MRITTLAKRLSLALGAAGLLASCGDNLSPPGSIDASIIDAEDHDSEDPVASRSGTIAVTEVRVTSSHANIPVGSGGPGGIMGGAISIEFSDLTQGTGGELIYSTNGTPSAVNNCIVTRFDSTHQPRPILDLGDVAITGNGLLKPMPPACTSAGDGMAYNCAMAPPVTGRDGAYGSGDGTGGLTIVSFLDPSGAAMEDFTAAPYNGNLTGMYLHTTGWDTAGNNTTIGSPTTGPLPILSIAGTTEGLRGTVVTPPRAGTGDEAEIEDDITYVFFQGSAPVPEIGGLFDPNFLSGRHCSTAATACDTDDDCPDDETCDVDATLPTVTIAKAADAVFPAINYTIDVQGSGFTLDSEERACSVTTATACDENTDCPDGETCVPAKLSPEQFPNELTDCDTLGIGSDCAQFACTPGASGTCGVDGGEAVEAMVINGRTTSQAVPAAPNFFMPTNGPTETYVTFQCGFLGAARVVIPDAFVEAVLTHGDATGTIPQPTRIETRVFRFAGQIHNSTDLLSSTNILVGHGYVGHVDVPTD